MPDNTRKILTEIWNHFWIKNDGEKWSRKNYFEIPRWPSEIPANLPGQFSLSGQIFLHLAAAALKAIAESFLDHFSLSFLSLKWCQISVRIFCVLSGTKNLQWGVLQFHKLSNAKDFSCFPKNNCHLAVLVKRLKRLKIEQIASILCIVQNAMKLHCMWEMSTILSHKVQKCANYICFLDTSSYVHFETI